MGFTKELLSDYNVPCCKVRLEVAYLAIGCHHHVAHGSDRNENPL